MHGRTAYPMVRLVRTMVAVDSPPVRSPAAAAESEASSVLTEAPVRADCDAEAAAPAVSSARSDASTRAARDAAACDAHADAETAFIVSFRREHPVLWLITLVGPIIATAVIVLGAWIFEGAAFTKALLGHAVATFFIFGKFVLLIGGGSADPEIAAVQRLLNREQLFLMLLWMDFVAACLLVFHAGFLYRIKALGPRLRSLAEDGQFILESNPWMRRATFIGLIAFVTFPLAATGSVGGALFGRLLGLSRTATFLGVILGSLIGCGAMYTGGRLISPYIDRDNPLVFIGGIAIVIGIIVLLNMRFQRMKRSAKARKAAAG